MASKSVDLHLVAFADAFTTPGAVTFGNATECALLAGYAKSGKRETARTMGCRLMKKPELRKLIAERATSTGHTADMLRLRVADIAFSDPGKKWEGSEILGACNLMAKMIPDAIVPTKAELTGKDGGQLVVEVIRYADTSQAPEQVSSEDVSASAAEVP